MQASTKKSGETGASFFDKKWTFIFFPEIRLSRDSRVLADVLRLLRGIIFMGLYSKFQTCRGHSE